MAVCLLAQALTPCVPVQAADPPSYDIVDLGVSSASNAYYGLNDLGQLVGGSGFLDGARSVSLKPAGFVGEIGAYSLDNIGMASAQWYELVREFTAPYAWRDIDGNGITSDGEVKQLPMIRDSVQGIARSSIPRGTMVGSSAIKYGNLNAPGEAVFWRIDQELNLTSRVIPLPEQSSGAGNNRAIDIEQNGRVIGTAAGKGHLWFHDRVIDFGTLRPEALNEQGHVVGATQVGAAGSPFVWRDADANQRIDLGEVVILSPEPGEAVDISQSGIVVGHLSQGASSTACLWVGGVKKDLASLVDPSSGWSFTQSVRINEAGMILARGRSDGAVIGPVKDVLLVPVAQSLAVVRNRCFNQGGIDYAGDQSGPMTIEYHLVNGGQAALTCAAAVIESSASCSASVLSGQSRTLPGRARGTLRIRVVPSAPSWTCSIALPSDDAKLPICRWTIVGERQPSGPGDLNRDRIVSVDDLEMVTKSQGRKRGDAGWDPRSDANGDGVVDAKDLLIVTQHYGVTWP